MKQMLLHEAFREEDAVERDVRLDFTILRCRLFCCAECIDLNNQQPAESINRKIDRIVTFE